MMRPIGFFGMLEPELRIGGIGDPNTQLCDVPRVILDQINPQGNRIDHHETIAPKGRIHRDPPHARHLERHAQTAGERGQVFDKNPLGLAIGAFRAHPHKAARRLKHHMRHRLLHRDNSAIQQHRRHADRV